MRTINEQNATDALDEIREALAKAGMPRTSTLAGAKNQGWLPPNHGSHDYSAKQDVRWDTSGRTSKMIPLDAVRVSVVISGKAAGLEYEEWGEYDSVGDYRDMHKPVDREKLNGRIRRVFTKLGYKVKKIESRGYQMHWDDDVDYEIVIAR